MFLSRLFSAKQRFGQIFVGNLSDKSAICCLAPLLFSDFRGRHLKSWNGQHFPHFNSVDSHSKLINTCVWQ